MNEVESNNHFAVESSIHVTSSCERSRNVHRAPMRRLASTEGLLLDPVYSGKAMSGFIGKVEAGEFSTVEDLVFLHTGGNASLPVYGEAILS